MADCNIQEHQDSSVKCQSPNDPQSGNFNADGWASFNESHEKEQVERKPNPQDKAFCLSSLTFWWFNWVIFTGYKRPLEDKDLWALRRSNRASYIVPRIRQRWIDQQRKCRQLNQPRQIQDSDRESDDENYKETDRLLGDGDVSEDDVGEQVSVRQPGKKKPKKKKEKKPSLSGILWSGLFGMNFAMAVTCKLLHDALIFIQPQLLKLIVGYVEDRDDWFGEWKLWKGYAYCGAMFVTAIISSLALHQYFHIMMTIGMRLRTAIIGLVYEKALILSSKARGKSTAGEMVNLMSVDAQRIMELMTYINSLWSSPLQIAGALYFLYDTMGLSILAGVGVLVLIIPLNMVFGSRWHALQLKQMAQKDERIKATNEVLNGIKVLKLYAWEESFMKQIRGIRNRELRVLRTIGFWTACFMFTFNCAPTLVAISTFAVYIFTGHELSASKAFVALSLFNVMRFPLVMLPDVIVSTIQARVSLKRLQEFLEGDELDFNNVHKTHLSSTAVKIENGSFSWSKKDTPVLREISLSIPSGSLVAVVGQVGCGKSSLISAILGETEKLQGKVFVEGSVAYVSQQAWIQNATVRENILFSRAFDSSRYDSVLDACALRPDLEMLTAGDATEIGERGINLSGGQKQRVSLARAVYFNADLYLMDDPLSAVDAHVGKHIFDNVVGPRGMLRNKTRVLVTHGIHFLPQVDQIIVIKDGRISECGTYSELQENSGAFAEFLQTYASANNSGNSSGDATKPSNIKRTISTISEESKDVEKASEKAEKKTEDDETGKMIDEEKSETGRVKFSVLLAYLKSVGPCVSIIAVMFLILMESCTVGVGVWLAYWSSANITTNKERDFYLGVYGGIGLGQGLFTFCLSITVTIGTILASRRLHRKLLTNIMHSPMSFFDTTPLGRIVNRFSKDIDVVDETLPRAVTDFLWCSFEVVGMIVAISYATPLYLSILPPIGLLYFYIQRVYVATSRQLKRIESVSRSPIYSHFLETINGASTIRAFSQQQHFIRDNFYRTDENQVAYYLSISSNRWLAIRLEFLGNCMILFAGLFAVISRDKIMSGLVGMSLTYSLEITDTLNWLVRMTSELETNLVAVERVKEYSETPTEAEWIKPDSRPPDHWPITGSIGIEEFDLRYREGLPLVLKQLNCAIKPGEKVGIVGRTGAGKSSLALALFRILERAGGSIWIDGIDIAKIGLHDLRSRLTIIPQDPVLFSGTLRLNLDPFDNHTDEELWKVLEVSHLKNFVSGLNDGLQHEVTEGGDNLSVGQRQLVCLARALLRKSKVLVLDEATAAVDLETDELIQQTIRREFADRTVITIAHRLNTIMDYDRVLVLDSGAIVELDSPSNLLQLNGVFAKMAKDANLA